MPYRWKTVATCLTSILLLAAAGCDRGNEGDQSPKTAIANPDSQDPSAEGVNGPSFKKPPSDPLHPVVLIETSAGNITVRLDAENSPQTVRNFLSYVNDGHYDRTIVHQVYRGQGFLAGGYDADLVERPSRAPIYNEAHNGLKNRRGTISMVRLPDAIDSATCQFFFNVVDNPELDHRDRTPEGYGYCVFGEVTKGMGVVDQIGDAPVYDTIDFERTPVQPIIITSIRRTY